MYFKHSVKFTTLKNRDKNCAIYQVRNLIAAKKYVVKVDTRIDGPWEIGEAPKDVGSHDKFQIPTVEELMKMSP